MLPATVLRVPVCTVPGLARVARVLGHLGVVDAAILFRWPVPHALGPVLVLCQRDAGRRVLLRVAERWIGGSRQRRVLECVFALRLVLSRREGRLGAAPLVDLARESTDAVGGVALGLGDRAPRRRVRERNQLVLLVERRSIRARGAAGKGALVLLDVDTEVRGVGRTVSAENVAVVFLLRDRGRAVDGGGEDLSLR